MALHRGFPGTDGLRELALFAGAGGGILGGALLGWTTVAAVEVDPFCREVLLRRQRDGLLPLFPVWDDVRTFDGKPWRGCVDVITAGFPCQPYSTAGRRAGAGDERNLWPDTLRCVREVGPRYALLENVPGLFSFPYFGDVLGGLAEVGYDAEWDVLSAASLGAPHLRERLWVLAYARGLRRDAGRSGEPLQGAGAPGEARGAGRKSADAAGVGLGRAEPGRDEEEARRRRGRNAVEPDKVGRTGLAADASADRQGLLPEPPGNRKKAGRVRQAYASVPGRHAPVLDADVFRRGGRRGGLVLAVGRAIGRLPVFPWWDAEPRLGRVAHGVPDRVDRLAAVGNAQVPQVAAVAFLMLARRAGLI